MDQTPPAPSATGQSERAAIDSAPHVAVAPDLLAGTPMVVRDITDSDGDVEARSQLLAAALHLAAQG